MIFLTYSPSFHVTDTESVHQHFSRASHILFHATPYISKIIFFSFFPQKKWSIRSYRSAQPAYFRLGSKASWEDL